jgi:hypothetical protein
MSEILEASNLGDLVYESLGFHLDTDEENDFALRKFCEALCDPMQPVYDLVREHDGQKGWTVLLDPENCPVEFLPYLAQYVGVEPQPGWTEGQLRAEIKAPTGWARRRTNSIKLAANRSLTGPKRVILHERTPKPGCTLIRTLASETPSEERTREDILSQLPAWQLLDYEAMVGVTWEDVAASYTDWGAVKAAFTDWADLADTLPSELPG